MSQDLTNIGGLDVSQLVLCTQCRHFRGPWTNNQRGTYVHHCRCDAAQIAIAGHTAETWPHYDYNTAIELCRCCTAEVLRSGSRWSVWFCEPCKERARNLNRHAGATIIPIGRHSMMHGHSLAGPAPSREDVQGFHLATVGLFGSIEHLRDWTDHAMTGHVRSIGRDSDPGLPLGRYLQTVATLDRAGEFHKMINFLADRNHDEPEEDATGSPEGTQ